VTVGALASIADDGIPLAPLATIGYSSGTRGYVGEQDWATLTAVVFLFGVWPLLLAELTALCFFLPGSALSVRSRKTLLNVVSWLSKLGLFRFLFYLVVSESFRLGVGTPDTFGVLPDGFVSVGIAFIPEVGLVAHTVGTLLLLLAVQIATWGQDASSGAETDEKASSRNLISNESEGMDTQTKVTIGLVVFALILVIVSVVTPFLHITFKGEIKLAYDINESKYSPDRQLSLLHILTSAGYDTEFLDVAHNYLLVKIVVGIILVLVPATLVILYGVALGTGSGIAMAAIDAMHRLQGYGLFSIAAGIIVGVTALISSFLSEDITQVCVLAGRLIDGSDYDTSSEEEASCLDIEALPSVALITMVLVVPLLWFIEHRLRTLHVNKFNADSKTTL